jgi:hypothetical protein
MQSMAVEDSLRASEVEVKREREKERKRTRDKEKERHREREKASRCTKRISAAKTGREVARARWKVADLDPRSSKSLAVGPRGSGRSEPKHRSGFEPERRAQVRYADSQRCWEHLPHPMQMFGASNHCKAAVPRCK